MVSGDYIFHEEVAPYGLKTVTDIHFTVTSEGTITNIVSNDETVTTENDGKKLIVTDQPDGKKEVLLFKKNDSNEMISGAELEISNNGEVIYRVTSDDQEPSKLRLDEGTYVLKEVTAAAGHQKVTDITFVVDADGNVSIAQNTSTAKLAEVKNNKELHVYDVQDRKEIKIKKVDMDTNALLEGVTLKLQKESTSGLIDVEEQWTTGASLTEKSFSLVAGKYHVKELAVPQLYTIADDFVFQVNTDGTITSTDSRLTIDASQSTVVITLKNKKNNACQITFRKVNESNTLLPGASISILDSQNNVVYGPVTTTEQAMNLTLNVGSYKIVESKAPTDYALPTGEAVPFTIDNQCGITSTSEYINSSGSTLDFINKQTQTHSISILKVDSKNQPLAGIQLKLTNSDNQTVTNGQWTTTTTPKSFTLPQGTYYLEEVNTPAQYVAIEKTKIVIDQSGNVTLGDQQATTLNLITVSNHNALTVRNEFNYQQVKIKKIDRNNVAISGATLALKNLSNNQVVNVTSSSDVVTVQLVPGTYQVSETVTPQGYVAITPFTMTVGTDGTITTSTTQQAKVENGILLVTDNDKEHTVNISKVNPAGDLVAGAKIKITNTTDSTIVYEFTSTTSVKSVGLIAGTYRFEEIDAPAGYEKIEPFNFIVNKDGSLALENAQAASYASISSNTLRVEDEYSPVKVTVKKINPSDSDKMIANVTFSISPAANGVESFTTSDANLNELTVIPETEYTLT